MHRLIFVNLPVADLARSRAFFTALGYSFDDEFCDDNAQCLVLGETLYAMLLTREFFAGFAPGDPVDARAANEVLLCLSVDSREAVDTLVERAVAAGGTAVRREDHGWMYGRSYADPDGHIWEIMWMADVAARQADAEPAATPA